MKRSVQFKTKFAAVREKDMKVEEAGDEKYRIAKPGEPHPVDRATMPAALMALEDALKAGGHPGHPGWGADPAPGVGESQLIDWFTWDAAIERAEKTLGRVSPLLAMVKDVVLCHQEKWDGSGYPRALAGTDIAAVKTAVEKLGTESQALGQAIYEAAQAEQAAGPGAPADSGADDVVDAEVVEDDQEKQ